ncbi:MAG TPA: hypothetical protein VGV87_31285 [Blastocatellia bacterium]|jgi:hypothetical protein|nr:hypothetical protein [Blastocatellia bacterium]
MQDRNARSYKPKPSRISITDKVEPSSSMSSRPDVSIELVRSVKKWSSGFVRPDGTRIRLFVPPISEA